MSTGSGNKFPALTLQPLPKVDGRSSKLGDAQRAESKFSHIGAESSLDSSRKGRFLSNRSMTPKKMSGGGGYTPN
jgi:hypothetical protein